MGDNGVEQDWPSLTKIYKASSSLIGATMWHPFDHQRGYHPDPFWGGNYGCIPTTKVFLLFIEKFIANKWD